LSICLSHRREGIFVIQKQLSGTSQQPVRLLSTTTQRLDLALKVKSLKDDISTDKVAGIKAEIAVGTYEDERKLDIAVDRLLDVLLAA
jgi:anti-sigma28 factor (negative regulator of flagellin synthesis)